MFDNDIVMFGTNTKTSMPSRSKKKKIVQETLPRGKIHWFPVEIVQQFYLEKHHQSFKIHHQ